jgi:hypothetical protein
LTAIMYSNGTLDDRSASPDVGRHWAWHSPVQCDTTTQIAPQTIMKEYL